MEKKAYLSNQGEYSSFTWKGRCIRFLTGNRLERYVSIKDWDYGYIVVMCKNHDGSVEEDYIDLILILKNLYMDPNEFLMGIEGVEIR